MSEQLRKSDWIVRPLTTVESRQLIQSWHYSRDFDVHPRGQIYVHGLIRRDDGPLGRAWGAAVWMPAVYAIRRYGVLPLQLSRLVVKPGAPKNAATFLLGHSMGMIDRTKWPVLLTYADSALGHTGAIYLATNWERDGEGAGLNYYDPATGRQQSSLKGGRFLPCPEGWETRRSSKYRFVHRASAASSDAAAIQVEESGSQPTPTLHFFVFADERMPE